MALADPEIDTNTTKATVLPELNPKMGKNSSVRVENNNDYPVEANQNRNSALGVHQVT